MHIYVICVYKYDIMKFDFAVVKIFTLKFHPNHILFISLVMYSIHWTDMQLKYFIL